MKKSSIIGIAVIGIAIAIIISTAGDASSYVTFGEAYEMASNGSKNKIHVVGELKKDTEGHVVGINPSADKTSVSFLMVDDNGKEQTVFLNDPLPKDLIRSEKVVVVGAFKNDMFVADKVLLKCPSKYEENAL